MPYRCLRGARQPPRGEPKRRAITRSPHAVTSTSTSPAARAARRSAPRSSPRCAAARTPAAGSGQTPGSARPPPAAGPGRRPLPFGNVHRDQPPRADHLGDQRILCGEPVADIDNHAPAGSADATVATAAAGGLGLTLRNGPVPQTQVQPARRQCEEKPDPTLLMLACPPSDPRWPGCHPGPTLRDTVSGSGSVPARSARPDRRSRAVRGRCGRAEAAQAGRRAAPGCALCLVNTALA